MTDLFEVFLSIPPYACIAIMVADVLAARMGYDVRLPLFIRKIEQQGISFEGDKSLYTVSRGKQAICLLLFLSVYMPGATTAEVCFRNGDMVGFAQFVIWCLGLGGVMFMFFISGFRHFVICDELYLYIFPLFMGKCIQAKRENVFVDPMDWSSLGVNFCYVGNRKHRVALLCSHVSELNLADLRLKEREEQVRSEALHAEAARKTVEDNGTSSGSQPPSSSSE